MRILTELCSVPTAPFAEERVIRYIERFVNERPKLVLRRDRFNNLLIQPRTVGKSKRAERRLVFVAHMDHPGLIVKRMIDGTTVDAYFRGGVLSELVQGAKVRFFDGDAEITGVVVATTPSDDRPNFPGGAKVRVKRPVAPGSAGMFDQGVGRVKNGKFLSRVCDDLAGVASALTMLDELIREPVKNPVAVLLTRAEEVGFVGAIASVLHPTLITKNDLIVSIECSAKQPYAQQGNGVILRVGDFTSIFNSSFMYFLHQQATALAKKDKNFKFQRSLMPGGTCEATVFDVYGYTAGAVCVPLGNYHNMDRDRKRIGPEYVDVNDWKNMVKLFVHVAKHSHEFDPDFGPLRKRIEKRFKVSEKFLKPSSSR